MHKVTIEQFDVMSEEKKSCGGSYGGRVMGAEWL